MRIGLALVAPQSVKGFSGAVRVCRRFEVVDVHLTSRLDNFASANQVFPGIARDGHQPRDGMAAVSDLDRFPGGHFFEVPAGVLPPQLSHPYRLHVLHSSTFDIPRRPRTLHPSTVQMATCHAQRAGFPMLQGGRWIPVRRCPMPNASPARCSTTSSDDLSTSAEVTGDTSVLSATSAVAAADNSCHVSEGLAENEPMVSTSTAGPSASQFNM